MFRDSRNAAGAGWQHPKTKSEFHMRAQTLGYQILRRARELLRRLGLVERSGRNSILSRGSSRTSQLEPDPLACLDWTQCLLIGPNANTA